MIIKKSIIVPVIILMMLFTSIFVSLNSMYLMPQEIMGNKNVYVLTSSHDRNPLRSNLNLELAYGLENTSYITVVSPEIFLFTTIKNQPVTLRGVEFKNFLGIEDGKIVMGSMPKNVDGALAGAKIFKFLHLNIGEKLSVYGSFQSSFAIINITGVFKTGSSADDEILVSLPTAQKLAGLKDNQVSIIRFKTDDLEKTKELLDPDYPKFTVNVSSVSQVYAYNKFNATVTIKNMGSEAGMCRFYLNFENQSFERDIYVSGSATFNVTLTAYTPGQQKIDVAVKNEVLYYPSFSQILVVKNPVVIKGKTLTYVNTSTNYVFLTSNDRKITNATLEVSNGQYMKIYRINYSANITFPFVGRYNLSFYKPGFESRNLVVEVFKRENLSALANITPSPVGNVVFVKRGESIEINAPNGTKIFYSLDNGLIRNTNSSIPLYSVSGNHILSLDVVRGWFMGNETFIVHIYNNSQIFANVPFSDFIPVYFNTTYNITLWSEVPFQNLSVRLDNRVIYPLRNYTFDFHLFNYTVNIPIKISGKESRLNLEIFAKNVVNRTLKIVVNPRVIHSSDTQKPEIIVGGTQRTSTVRCNLFGKDPVSIRIWSGMPVEVKAYDALGVTNLTVQIFNRTYYSSPPNTGEVDIPTMEIRNGEVYFMPEGIYEGIAKARDAAGNVNETYFEVIINNTGEKLPPIVLGSGILNFNGGKQSYKMRIFDNTLIEDVKVYVNGTPIELYENLSVENFTVWINSSQVPDGFYKGYIYAQDIYGNQRSFPLIIIKNFTDTVPPKIDVVKTKIWSGEDIVIRAKDDTLMKKLSVFIFGKWFNGTREVKIPTMEILNNSVEFVSPGVYIAKIYAEDIFNNENNSEVRIEINNTGEKIPPVIILPSVSVCNATDYINFTAYDNVGVKRISLIVFNRTVASADSNNISVRAEKLGYGFVTVEIYAADVNGNVAVSPFRMFVMDNIPPQVNDTYMRIWSGNTTNVTLWDDVGIKYATLSIFGKIFRSSGNRIEIKTMEILNDTVYFIPPGRYVGKLVAEDYSGNVNSTYVTVIINNTGEKIPPIILGKTYDIISNNKSAIFRAFDNVGLRKMWWTCDGMIRGESENGTIVLHFSQLSIGIHNATIYAEDLNGNIAHMNVTLDVVGTTHVNLRVRVENSNINTNQRAIINIEIINGPNRGKYSTMVYLDNSPYYLINLTLTPYETLNLILKIPYLPEGIHKIMVGNETVTIRVSNPYVEKLPIDLLLRYDKNLNVTGGKEVIYKGFQISEGNFIILIYSLIGVGMVLVILGMYSSLLKALKERNIAVLRAIGATNSQILKFALKDSFYYIFLPIIFGIVVGYIMLFILQYFEVLRAFGHRLIISTNIQLIFLNLLIGLGFAILTMAIVFKDVLSSKVVHLFSGETGEREVDLKEVFQ